MKPSTTALIGAMMISGGWMSLPAVAFADGETVSPPAAASGRNAGHGDVASAKDEARACSADAHGHSSSCTCARCAASQAE
jgi:hypothetical protein